MLNMTTDLSNHYCHLDDWQLVKVSGIDSQKFLQGQLTVDINQLTETHFVFSAHCDPKGKVWSNLLLFKRGDDIYYLIRKSVADIQIKELKKYAVFSKVTIEVEESLEVIGIVTKIPFSDKNNCATNTGITYLKILHPYERYLIIGDKAIIAELDCIHNTQKMDPQFWLMLDMQANYPIIDASTTNQFLPQSLNLQNMDAINFDKGCYCGQEMVARAQYRGINKRSLFLLTGHSENLPTIGDSLEQQLGENWRETGTVLATIQLENNQVLVQAVLNNDIELETQFRVKNQLDSQLLISQI